MIANPFGQTLGIAAGPDQRTAPLPAQRPMSVPTANAAVESDPRRREVANKRLATECDRLLLAAAGGDGSAFKQLYQLTSARVFAVIRRSIWARGEAEEVLQDVYLKIWTKAATFDPAQAQAITWMSTVARNHAIDHLRRGAARKAHEIAGLDEPGNGESDQLSACDIAMQAICDDSPRPEEFIELREQDERFDSLMGRLNAVQRQVMVMAFRENCTQAEIALRMDAPLGSVKSWMRRGLQRLKTLIDEDDQQPTRCDA